ncbi:MAG: aldo/keto reductase [Anaerolineales bacterium]|nr:aldo/keto reductase [Anaerolineales bacterium]
MMEYRNLGRTGVKVSQLCLGCMNFGGRTDEADSIRIIDAAIDAGINFLDTANVYGHNPQKFIEGRGRSEKIVGKALRGKRERVFLTTKVHYPMGEGPNARGNSRYHIMEQCHASLQRLNIDHIDLYQLHAAGADIPIDETLMALDDLVRAGKVRYIGVSGFPAWKLVEALWVSKEKRLNRFVSEQPPYSLLDRRVERDLLPMAQTYGLAVIPWAPLGGGFLAGKYHRDTPPPSDSRFGAFWTGFWQEHREAGAFDVLDVVLALSAEKGCTPSQLSLAWNMAQPGITSPIIGPRTVAQLEDNLGATAVSLTSDDIEKLDAVAPPGEFTVPYYGGAEWVGWHPNKYRWC